VFSAKGETNETDVNCRVNKPGLDERAIAEKQRKLTSFRGIVVEGGGEGERVEKKRVDRLAIRSIRTGRDREEKSKRRIFGVRCCTDRFQEDGARDRIMPIGKSGSFGVGGRERESRREDSSASACSCCSKVD